MLQTAKEASFPAPVRQINAQVCFVRCLRKLDWKEGGGNGGKGMMFDINPQVEGRWFPIIDARVFVFAPCLGWTNSASST